MQVEEDMVKYNDQNLEEQMTDLDFEFDMLNVEEELKD